MTGALRSSEETFRSLSGRGLKWPSPFALPAWMNAWHEAFAPDGALWIRSFWDQGGLTGVAPLIVRDGTARLIGDPSVCDHLDLTAAGGREPAFCRALLETLRSEGITRLELDPLRPDATALRSLAPWARAEGYAVSVRETDVLFEMDLPRSWGEYLERLSGKQRHEVRRKLRRLENTAASEFRLAAGAAGSSGAADDFFILFRQNREDKAAFMNERMEAFFRLLVERVPEMRIGLLLVDGAPAAGVLCCDHEGTRYLYNSGYDARLAHLSVGILCKILSIRDGIARGMGRYDFLKGAEPYKHQLGGRPVPVLACRIELD